MQVNLELEEVRCISFMPNGQRREHWAAPGWWTITGTEMILSCSQSCFEYILATRLKRGKEVIYVGPHALDNIRKEKS